MANFEQTAMQAEQAALEHKNIELAEAFREKAQRQQQLQKLYQNLKAQLMSSRVVNAAGDKADMTIHNTARGDRYVNRIPGMRTGATNLGQYGAGVDGLGGDRMTGATQRPHNRQGSGSSGERDTGNAFGLGQTWNNQGQTFQGNAARNVYPSCTKMQYSECEQIIRPPELLQGSNIAVGSLYWVAVVRHSWAVRLALRIKLHR